MPKRTTSRAVRPEITVKLLPRWSEKKFKKLFDSIVSTAAHIPALHVAGENDIIVDFPKDLMKKGLGADIPIQVLVPVHFITNPKDKTFIAKAIVTAVRQFLPKAVIQCKVDTFDTTDGFWSIEIKRK